MGYTQRLVIGVLITIYAYSLFQDANMRFQFHQLVAKISEKAQIESCYICTQQVRNVLAAFIFASGVSLVFDISIYMGVLSEVFLLGFSAFNLSGCFCYGKIQTGFIHLLILLVLIANAKSQFSKPGESKNEGCGDHACNVKHPKPNKVEPSNEKLVGEERKVSKQQSAASKKQGKRK